MAVCALYMCGRLMMRCVRLLHDAMRVCVCVCVIEREETNCKRESKITNHTAI